MAKPDLKAVGERVFTVVCDYDGGTYVSQYSGRDAVGVARQWSDMLRTERPIPRSSGHIANRVVRDLDEGELPVSLTGLSNVWQIGGIVGGHFYTATIILSAG